MLCNEKTVKLNLPICRLAGKNHLANNSESFFNTVWQYYELLDLQFFEAYNLGYSGVVSVCKSDREGDARWKSPQGNSAEVARSNDEERRLACQVDRHGNARYSIG